MTQKAAPLKYEPRCLVFVDILGWSDLVERSVAAAEARERIAAVYRRFFNTTKFIQGLEATDPDEELGWAATLMSDSLAVSCRPEHADVLLRQVASDFAFLLLRHETYVRGGIVLGDLYHHANVIIGPALLEAVALEKAACFPRIVVAATAADIVPRQMTMVDADGARVLNFLRLASDNHDNMVTQLKRAREVIERKLVADAAHPSLTSKHSWLLRQVADLEHAASRRGQGSKRRAGSPK